MSFKHTVTVIVTLALCAFVNAQQTFYLTEQDNKYREALELYNNGKYSAAQVMFDGYVKEHPFENSEFKTNSEYYAAMAAIKLFNNDAEGRIVKFLEENPENPHRNEALFSLAGYFYQKKSYTNALIYYEQVNESRLNREDWAELQFKKGYCYFLKEDFEKARLAFNQIKDQDTKYTAPALYYYAHINYTQGNYQTALESFLKLRDDANFGPIVPYYLTQIYYKQKKYDDVIKFAPALMQNVTEKREPEIARITGESYIQLNLSR